MGSALRLTRKANRQTTSIAPMIENASRVSLENARINPATVMTGAGRSISMAAIYACWIWVMSLVHRVIMDAVPNRLNSFRDSDWDFWNRAFRISLPMIEKIHVVR